MKKTVVCCLLFLIVLSILILSGCQNSKETKTDDESTAPETETNPAESTVPETPNEDTKTNLITNFSVSAFKECYDENNTLLSPISIMYALTMTANGADGNTLAEMEKVLGNTTGDLNTKLKVFSEKLPQGDKFSVQIANSIWFKDNDSFSVSENFLNTNKEYYGAEVYRSSFDKKTIDQMNEWVKEKTKGMIPEIVKDLSPSLVMCLLNTVAFEAEWADPYDGTYSVRKEVFTTADNKSQECDFLFSTEDTYIKGENSVGVVKYYNGYDYAFVAILPDESISLTEYVSGLTGDKINNMLNNQKNGIVHTRLPKFENEYSITANEMLKNMGMIDAFDSGKADFSKIGSSSDGNIYISNILHKTYIAVTEKGTKAGAVTSVFLEAEMGNPTQTEIINVYLDRPFLYMIIECDSNTPLFIGAVNSIE